MRARTASGWLAGFLLAPWIGLSSIGRAATVTVVATHGVGDDHGALEAPIGDPVDVAVAPDGSLYVVDALNFRLRVVTPDGVISTAAGTGVARYGGDGGPARTAGFSAPAAAAVDSSGSVYVVDKWAHRRIDAGGAITTVAGNRTMGSFGEGGPADGAGFSCADVVPGPAGELYGSDPLNHRVAVIRPDGKIETYAGNGSTAYYGDGGPARAAAIFAPAGLAVDRDGNLFVADLGNNRIRKVRPDGTIETVAGSGEQGFSGDGGPAIAAKLDGPRAVAIGPDDVLYISDARNRRIRRVDKDGTIATVAGDSSDGTPPDGVAAIGVPLGVPGGLAVRPDGTLVVAIPGEEAIREIDPVGRVWTRGDAASPVFDVALDQDEAVVAATPTAIIRFSSDSAPIVTAGDGQEGGALGVPASIAAGAAGELYVCDAAGRRILRLSAL